MFSLGASSNRDDWVYGFDEVSTLEKVAYLIDMYEAEKRRWQSTASRPAQIGDFLDRSIKWTADLQQALLRGEVFSLDKDRVFVSAYRPFVRKHLYFSPKITHRMYQNAQFFPNSAAQNQFILFSNFKRAPYGTHAVSILPNTDYFVPDVATGVARYRFTSSGERIDNITDWAERRFREHYGAKAGVGKDAIFAYVYAVLHDPVYRETFAINLRREFPHIPFYPDFPRWAEWGRRLMDLHIGYETVEPWPLARSDVPDAKARAAGLAPRPVLRSDHATGTITLDSETRLSGVPPEAWAYCLGNRTALDWVLDQHKEKTPRDPTIRARFNSYRFADHKERVADLLARVTRVSVETVAIVEAMRAAQR